MTTKTERPPDLRQARQRAYLKTMDYLDEALRKGQTTVEIKTIKRLMAEWGKIIPRPKVSERVFNVAQRMATSGRSISVNEVARLAENHSRASTRNLIRRLRDLGCLRQIDTVKKHGFDEPVYQITDKMPSTYERFLAIENETKDKR